MLWREEAEKIQSVMNSLENVQCQILFIQSNLEEANNELWSAKQLLEDLLERRRRNPSVPLPLQAHAVAFHL